MRELASVRIFDKLGVLSGERHGYELKLSIAIEESVTGLAAVSYFVEDESNGQCRVSREDFEAIRRFADASSGDNHVSRLADSVADIKDELAVIKGCLGDLGGAS